MSWFHRDHGGKVHPILKNVDHSTILGAEVADGRLAKLCYTGHSGGASNKGVVQAIVPGGEMLWRTELAEEDDVREGHVATDGRIVVTRVKHGKAHELVGHDLWTGVERWRRGVGQMVTRMGVAGDRIVFVTFDHAVHDVAIDTGEDRLRAPVMTNQAAARVIDATRHPVQSWARNGASTSHADWSAIYAAGAGIEVYERDWAGTCEFGVGMPTGVDLIGSGSYQGAMTVGPVVVLGFRLDRDDGRHHHWYVYATQPVALLAVLREDGKSELYGSGHNHPVWQGKL